VGTCGYFWVLVLFYLMPKPSVAESLTWTFAIEIPKGRQCGDGWVQWVWLGTGTCLRDSHPSVAESLTWALAIKIPEGEAVRGQMVTVGYRYMFTWCPSLCCRISDLGLAVEIPEGEAVRGRVGTSGYRYLFT
jgi:hypothetical protein